jgi:hypothetical protein
MMKHAGAATLDLLEPLMERVRVFSELKEKKRGSFYRKGRGFLHFHEDPAGLFADLSIGFKDIRMRVNAPDEQDALLIRIHEVLRGA